MQPFFVTFILSYAFFLTSNFLPCQKPLLYICWWVCHLAFRPEVSSLFPLVNVVLKEKQSQSIILLLYKNVRTAYFITDLVVVTYKIRIWSIVLKFCYTFSLYKIVNLEVDLNSGSSQSRLKVRPSKILPLFFGSGCDFCPKVSILKFQLSITCQVWWVNNGRLSITCQKWWVNKEKKERTAALQQHWSSTQLSKQAAVISFFSHHFWQVIDRQWKLTSDVTICDLWLLFEVSKIIDWCQISVLTFLSSYPTALTLMDSSKNYLDGSSILPVIDMKQHCKKYDARILLSKTAICRKSLWGFHNATK